MKSRGGLLIKIGELKIFFQRLFIFLLFIFSVFAILLTHAR